MLSTRFLVVNIIEIINEEMIDGRPILSSSSLLEIDKIHNFNPLTTFFTRKNYEPQIKLFPENTRNLNGHKIKVSLFSKHPLASFTLDHKGHVLKNCWFRLYDHENFIWSSEFTNSCSRVNQGGGFLAALGRKTLDFSATRCAMNYDL